jgi:hypothetical protein
LPPTQRVDRKPKKKPPTSGGFLIAGHFLESS